MSQNLPNYLVVSSDINADLNASLAAIKPDKTAVLVDENSKQFCLPKIDTNFDIVIEIKSGEQEKNLLTCESIWTQLTKNGFSRKSLLVNLGGGVIGDMGGFVAATYKRGMGFINIPTTLLSQVDASIGGKLGIDFNGLKNHIGVFQEPNQVIVHTDFLETLSAREIKSGFAEIIKHALIRDQVQWNFINNTPFESIDWREIIPKSIAIKNEIVNKDPREQGLRKILNYGHTVGHAVETFFLNSSDQLLHGEAVVCGMILENELAVKMGMLNEKESQEIKRYLERNYALPDTLPKLEELKGYLLQDKKNDSAGIRFSLLERIGSCAHDVLIDPAILATVLK